MEIILINFLGALLGIAVAMVFFRTLRIMKKIKLYAIIGGVLLIAIANVVLTSFLLNTVLLPAISIVMMFALSFFFISGIMSRILFSFIITAIMFSSEQLVGVIFVNVLSVPLEQVQGDALLYFIGVVTSNLLALFIAYAIRIVMKGYRKETDNQFIIIMLLMPMQSIIICFVIYFYSISAYGLEASPLGITAILVSLSLVFITIFIIANLQRAIAYKSDYELAKERIGMQLEQYQKLYQEQSAIRKIRHDISNNLIAITGTLEDGRTEEAIDRINSICSSIGKSETIADTGIPELDAVISAKFNNADKSGIRIIDKISIDSELNIDGYDIACIVASALDNAIEGILRSSNVEKSIRLSINCVSGFLVLLVENYASGPVYNDFQTSKKDKANHGFGIAQMRTIAEKYRGTVQLNYNSKNMMFSLKILLKNKNILHLRN